MTSVESMRAQARRLIGTPTTVEKREQVIEIASEKASVWAHGRLRLGRALSQLKWKRRLANLGARSEIMPPAWIEGGVSVAIGDDVRIWRGARIEALNASRGTIRVEIGDKTVIQPFLHIGAVQSVRIGNGCLFASHVYITDHDHDFTRPLEPVITNNRVIVSPVDLGDYVWLGERVMILKGVSIGERSVVGAGSIVTRDIPPLSIAVGSPARVVRQWNETTGQWETVNSA